MIDQLLDFTGRIEVAEKANAFVAWMTEAFAFIFDPVKDYLGAFMEWTAETLFMIPALIVIIVVALVCYWITGKKYGLAAFSVIGLWFIYNQGLWEELMFTLTLVLFASGLSVLIGVPLGIWMSKNKRVSAVLSPILDFMQTMPAFVYLIPAVAFFGIEMVPGVFASFIFAVPPTVRFTNLGIRNVSQEMTEAAEAFGSTGWQKLYKVELPMAKDTILAGINQTVMLALSMVVVASMIGAPGLGHEVLTALQRAQVGVGFVAGLGIVILAIIIDRITQNIGKKQN